MKKQVFNFPTYRIGGEDNDEYTNALPGIEVAMEQFERLQRANGSKIVAEVVLDAADDTEIVDHFVAVGGEVFLISTSSVSADNDRVYRLSVTAKQVVALLDAMYGNDSFGDSED